MKTKAIATALLLICSVMSGAASAERSVSAMVLPFEIDSSISDHEWLGSLAQDSITIDLWHAGLNAPPISQYLGWFNLPAYRLNQLAIGESARVAREHGIRYLWAGSIAPSTNGEIKANIKVTDTMLSKTVLEISLTSAIPDLLSELSKVTLSMLRQQGFPISENMQDAIESKKSSNELAMWLNAEGYAIQTSLASLRRVERREVYGRWVMVLEAAVSEDPSYAEAWNNLGWAYLTIESRDKAAIAFNRALRIKPFMIDPKIGMSNIERHDKNHKSAYNYALSAYSANKALQSTRDELLACATLHADMNALDVLLELRDNTGPDDRIKLIKALGNTGQASVVPILGQYSLSKDESVAREALKAMVSIDREMAMPYIADYFESSDNKYDIALFVSTFSPKESVSLFIKVMQDRRSDFSAAATRNLGVLRDKEAIPALIEALGYNTDVCLNAIWSLQQIGDPSVIDKLLPLLDDSRPIVREQVAVALGEFGSKAHVAELTRLFQKDSDEKIRASALMSLAYIGESWAFAELQNILSMTDAESAKTRDYIIMNINRKKDLFKNSVLAGYITK